MTGDLPTKAGDVLIIATAQSFHIYAVGRVSVDGQQHFHGDADVGYLSDLGAAVAAANALTFNGRRTFLLHLDTGHWETLCGEGALRRVV